MEKHHEFHPIATIWLWLCLVFWAFVFVYNVYLLLTGFIRGDYVGIGLRFIFGICLTAMLFTCIGFINILFKKRKKGFWEALFYPMGAGFLSVGIMMVFGSFSFDAVRIWLVPTILVPGVIMFITYLVLQIRHDGIRGWDLLD